MHTSPDLFNVLHVAWVPARTSTQPGPLSATPPPRGGVPEPTYFYSWVWSRGEQRNVWRDTHRATMLCFLRLNQTHIHTHLGRHTHSHTQRTRERVQSSRANADQNQLGNTHSTHGTNWNLNGLHWQKSRSSWRKHRLTNETLTHKHAKAVVCHSRFEPLVKNRRKNSNSTVKRRFSQ